MGRILRTMARWGTALGLAVSSLSGGADRTPAALAAPGEARIEVDAERRAARRRWALRRMDEMANERLRCRERLAKKREVEACEADFARRFREFNELYLEASRE
jgi:hypothetical protein